MGDYKNISAISWKTKVAKLQWHIGRDKSLRPSWLQMWHAVKAELNHFWILLLMVSIHDSDAWSQPNETYKIERFEKIANG